MPKYKMTSEQFKTITELKSKFGDVSLLELYYNATVNNRMPLARISEDEFQTIASFQFQFGDISLSTLLNNPDYNHAMNQHQRNNIEYLLKGYGDVGLIDLHYDAGTHNGYSFAIPPYGLKKYEETKQASVNLTDKQIEQLLNEKIANMDMYSFYNLAERKAGYQRTHYNGVKCNRIYNTNDFRPQRLRRLIEGWHVETYLPVLFAIKTINLRDGTYDKNSQSLATNMILYDTYGKHFYTLQKWVGYQGDAGYAAGAKDPKITSEFALQTLFHIGNIEWLLWDESRSPILQINKTR